MLNELILSCSFQVTCSLCGSKPEPQIRTLKAPIHIFNESSTIFQGIQHGIIWKKTDGTQQENMEATSSTHLSLVTR